MKLAASQSSGSLYPKFVTVGDVIEGRFVQFRTQVPGTFGPEDVLSLEREDGAPLTVRCSAMLSAVFRDNPDAVSPGQWVKMTFTHTTPNKKGQPTKHYDVDVADPAEAPSPAQAAPRQAPPAQASKPQPVQARPAARPTGPQPRTYGQPQRLEPESRQANLGDDESDIPF